MQLFCERLPNDEWSALLLYKIVNGSIETPNELEMEVKYIWPMKKGTSAAVSFDYDEDWIEVYEKLEEAEDCKLGIIHSHNTMGSYHSTTDIKDLSDNCDVYDFYLSVVVNNRMELDAKIAVAGVDEKKVISNFRSVLGRAFSGLNKENTELEDVMFIYDVQATAVIPDKVINIFTERMEQVIEKDKSTSYYGYGRGYDRGNEYSHNKYSGWRHSHYYDDYNDFSSPRKNHQKVEKEFEKYIQKEEAKDKLEEEIDIQYEDELFNIVQKTLKEAFVNMKILESSKADDLDIADFYNEYSKQMSKESEEARQIFIKRLFTEILKIYRDSADFKSYKDKDNRILDFIEAVDNYNNFFTKTLFTADFQEVIDDSYNILDNKINGLKDEYKK